MPARAFCTFSDRLILGTFVLIALCGCNLSDDSIRGFIASSLSLQASEDLWTFKNLTNYSKTSMNNPVIRASGFSSMDGSTVTIFSDANCSHQVGQNDIENGDLEVSNITLSSPNNYAVSYSFYAQVSNAKDRPSVCTPLPLELTYLPDPKQLVLKSLYAFHYDELNPDQLLIVDVSNTALIEANLSTGSRSLLSDRVSSTGQRLEAPYDIALSPDKSYAYSVDLFTNQVLRTHLETRITEVVSDSSRGSGPSFGNPAYITLNNRHGRLRIRLR